MGKQPITVFWKNIRGETIYAEDMLLSDVLALIDEDTRAAHNTFRLPTGSEVTEIQLREWYASQTGSQAFAL